MAEAPLPQPITGPLTGPVSAVLSPRVREAFSSDPSGFEAELNDFLQDRLVRMSGLMALTATALLLIGRVADVINHGWSDARMFHPSVIAHAVSCLVATGTWYTLKRRQFGARGLLCADSFIVAVLTVSCVLIYAFSYTTGIRQLAPLLGLLLIARAVFVPSRARRTILLSLPAPIAILAIQLSHGQVYTIDGNLFPQEGFATYVLWEQVVLAMAIAIAAITSWVSYHLRMKAYEAGRIDQYVLEERIGEGAMGEVFRARHALMRRPTAIKVLRPEIASAHTLQRFEAEVQETSRLTHPNTVGLFDYGQTAEGLYYYAMEWLEGADLGRIIEVTGPLPASRTIHALTQILEALEEAHELGLVHRDLKPENLMLCRYGGQWDVAKVLDFGLVKDTAADAGLSQEGRICGTPLTMAPEMIKGGDVTPATDLYALAAVGYYMLAGQLLFDGETPADVLVKHLKETPVPPSEREPSVPSDLEAVLLHCLAKDPADRPQSAAEVCAELDACADAGAWTREDATAWWAEHLDELRRPSE